MDHSNGSCADLSRLVAGNSNKEPVQEPTIMLPPDILNLVCGILCKEDLKQVRQTSKIWERAAVPYLFDEIFISQDLADFVIAKLVILHFKHYIRTLVFSSVYYTRVDRETFDREFDFMMDNFSNDVGTDNGHSEYAFAIYRIMRKNQQENLMNGSSSAYLFFALASLPNVRKVILTFTSSSRSMPYQSLQVYQARRLKACPFKQCDLTVADHLPYEVCQYGFSRKGSTNPWRLVLSALSATNASVRELTMEPGDMDVSTNTAAFSMSPGNLCQAKICLQILTKIRFSLMVDDERFSNHVDIRHVHQNVAKLLSSAVNLQSLSLDLNDEAGMIRPGYSTLREILGQCKYPKLRSLILAYFSSSDEELLRLLKYSKDLQQITIDSNRLVKGSWRRVADWMRASLPQLKHAKLGKLYGGFDEPFESMEYLDLYEDVGNFLFANGENPFTAKALEKHQADIEAKREVVSSTGGLSFIEAYAKYH